ncbi:MAG TPA: GDSL-type esterase/lipase family protein [Solimonas sp.]|nr:GDSL-type esterase/lipase family protein [Solimonas sp.]
MKRSLLGILVERLIMRKLWSAYRDGLEVGAVPGCGGVVFLGDSLTHNGRWELMFPDSPVRNFGIGGERSEHLLTRLQPIISVQPSKIFILIGTNDLAANRTIDAISADVDTLVERLQAALPGCALHLQTLMPRKQKFAARIRQINTRYQAIATRRGIPCIDLFPAFDDGTGTLRKELTWDALHLSGRGYQVWRDLLAPHVLAGSRS